VPLTKSRRAGQLLALAAQRTEAISQHSGNNPATGPGDSVARVPLRPLRSLTVTPPDTHRRFNFNLRCVSGEATEGLGRGWGGRLSPETSLFAETGLIRPGLAVEARTWVLPGVSTPGAASHAPGQMPGRG